MFLEEILNLKKARVEAAKASCDIDALIETAQSVRAEAEPFRLTQALSQGAVNIIAEYKRASPSKGVINENWSVSDTALAYENGGACAMSVLTEEDKFKGTLNDLKTARAAVSMPILRKDFVYDAFQIYEAAAAGADVVLLIVAMLSDGDLHHLYKIAHEQLHLDVLVEVHTYEELERAKQLGATVGVNNRNLKTFEVTLDTSRDLIKLAPKDTLMVTESGITTKAEIDELRALGYKGFLIGETLMRAGDPKITLAEFTADAR